MRSCLGSRNLAIICSLIATGCSAIASGPTQGTAAPGTGSVPQVVQSGRPGLPTSAAIPPDSTVPRDLARWSGIWFGKWDGIWFTAIVVKKIEPTGTAAVEYNWVERVGEPYTTRSVSDARIEDGALSFGRIRLIMDSTNLDHASGEVAATNGRVRHSEFTKTP